MCTGCEDNRRFKRRFSPWCALNNNSMICLEVLIQTWRTRTLPWCSISVKDKMAWWSLILLTDKTIVLWIALATLGLQRKDYHFNIKPINFFVGMWQQHPGLFFLKDSQSKQHSHPESYCEEWENPKWQSCSLFKLWNGLIMLDHENALFKPNEATKNQCHSLIIFIWNLFLLFVWETFPEQY